MMQQKLVDEISLNFTELFLIGKYVKLRFKNGGWPCYFCSLRGQKIKNITKTEQKRLYLFTLFGFIFYGVSRAKTDLHNKYMILLWFYPIFERDGLLNLIILGVYAKRWPQCALISKQELIFYSNFDCQKTLPELISAKTEILYPEFIERVEAATSSYSAIGNSVLVAKNHPKIR